MRQNKSQTISIIIPVLNEENCIGDLLKYLNKHATPNILEILVVDGGSTDKTVQIASEHGAIVLHSDKGRAKQMNFGAQHAKGSIYYFLHGDTYPPDKFDIAIVKAVENNIPTGCFQMKFDSNNLSLYLLGWLTKINHPICRGGDQSLFITSDLYGNSGGFNEAYIIYEDNEYISRLYKIAPFKILPLKVLTSARRFEHIGILRLQYHFGVLHLKSFFGATPQELYNYYDKKIST